MKIAIVTGASSGLGVELAKRLDRETGIDIIWLVARREDRLLETASMLTLPTRIFILDLTEPDAIRQLAASLLPDDQVVWLVNNAGMGIAGPFRDHASDDVRLMMRLNNEVPLMLTSSLAPFLREKSRILNVASVAGFLPQPGFAVYAATKAMLISFSRALNQEMRDRGITVTTCCPNPMETEFFLPSQANGLSMSGVKRIGLESPLRVADLAVNAAKKGRDMSVSHPFAKIIRVAAKVLPASVLFWFMRRAGIH